MLQKILEPFLNCWNVTLVKEKVTILMYVYLMYFVFVYVMDDWKITNVQIILAGFCPTGLIDVASTNSEVSFLNQSACN